MTSENHSRTQQTAAFPKGTFIGLAVLVSILVAAVLLADYFGDKSPPYRRAIALTGMICGIGSVTGWLVSRIPFQTAGIALSTGLAGVFFRLSMPLAMLVWLQSEDYGFRQSGAYGLLAFFYLILLATDIILNIIWSRKATHSRKKIAVN